jgi:ketosteroid isomerase-like protein
MSQMADDIVWIAADNSPLADRSPYRGIAEVRSGVFERIEAGFDRLVVVVDEIFECEGGRVVVLGCYHGKFAGQSEEFRAQVAHIWTIRDGRAVKFQQYLDTLQIARDSGAVQA